MLKCLNGGWKINFQETVLTFGGIIVFDVVQYGLSRGVIVDGELISEKH